MPVNVLPGSSGYNAIAEKLGEGIQEHAQQRLAKMQYDYQMHAEQQREREKIQRGANLFQRLGFAPEAAIGMASDPKTAAAILERSTGLSLKGLYGGQQGQMGGQPNEFQQLLQQYGKPEHFGTELGGMIPQAQGTAQPQIGGNFIGGQEPTLGPSFKQQNLEIKQKQLANAQKKEARDELRPLAEKYRASEKNIRDNNAIIKLAEKGDVKSGPMYKLLEKYGLQGLILNPTTELLGKFAARLGQNAVSAFGTGKLTNFLEQTYQKSNPSLWNTPTGLIANAKVNNLGEESNKLAFKEGNKIIKENGGDVPVDFDEQLIDRLAPEMQRIEDETIKVLEDVILLQSGNFGAEEDALPAPSAAGDKYYVTELHTTVSSPDGKKYIRDDNGEEFDWQKYNKGAK